METEGNGELTPIQMIEKLKGTEEFNKLLENHAKTHFETQFTPKINEKTAEIYGNVDSVLHEILGLEKTGDAKTTENVKKIAEELKLLRESGNPNKKLEEALEEQKRLQKAKFEKLSKDLSEKDRLIEQLKTQGMQQISRSELSSELADRTFKASLGETELKELLEIRMNRLVNNSKQHEGKTIYYEDAEKTKPYLNTLGDPMSVKEVVDIVFGSLYQTNKKGGAADMDTPPNATEGEVVKMDVANIKTRDQFYKAIEPLLAKEGHKPNSKKALEITRATLKHYKLDRLPLS